MSSACAPRRSPRRPAPNYDRRVEALSQIDAWDVPFAAAGVTRADATVATHGETGRSVPLASLSKPIAALATLVAAEEGVVDLDEAAGPPGATVRHLLAHASGLPFEGDAILARPGTRRIYSNPGFDLLGALVAERDGSTIEDALRRRVLDPLGMAGTTLVERPSQGLHGPLRDLAALAGELLRPTLLPAARFAEATTVAFPGLPG